MPWPWFLVFVSVCPGTRGEHLALSTLYDIHHAACFALVGQDGSVVLALDSTKRAFRKLRVGSVPVEAGEVLLDVFIYKDFAVARVDFVTEFTRVFDEQ